MALHWRPVGPEPAQTYWQRRAVVAVLALAVLLLVVLLLRALLGGGDEDRLAEQPAAAPTTGAGPSVTTDATASPSFSGSPTASTSPTATPSPTPAATACGAGSLEIDAAAEQDSYPVGASPRLELRVTNTGPTACTLDLGQASVELVVVSGPDRIWSSDDCASGGDADPVTLEPGAIEVSRVTWPGTRSRPGCDGEQTRARAGTYRVQARVGDQRVQGQPFLLR